MKIKKAIFLETAKFLAASSLFLLFLGYGFYFEFLLFSYGDFLSWFLLFVLVYILFSFIIALLEVNEEAGRSKETLKSAEQKAEEKDVEFTEYLKNQLSLLVAKSRDLMIQAQFRADLLYRTGVALTLFAICGPLLGFFFYQGSPGSIGDILEALKDTQALPDGVSLTYSLQNLHPQRDWRILLSGTTAGFLFLAAAAGTFSQHRRQTQQWHSLAQDVAYYDGLITATELRKKSIEEENLDERMGEFLDAILKELLVRKSEREETTEESTKDVLSNAVKVIAQLTKRGA